MRADAVRRVLDAELAAVRRRNSAAPRVLDVGGGSGVLAVPLAVAGCEVTVVEPSPNALATLWRRAAEAGVSDRVHGVQGDSDALADLVEPDAADLVLAHGLLEVVDEPKTTVAAMAAATAPGGLVSVLAANRHAAVLHRAIAGRLAEVRALLTEPDGRTGDGESLLRRFDSEMLRVLLADAGLIVELVQGDGVLRDLVPGAVAETDEVGELELLVAQVPQLREVAARVHVLARRPPGVSHRAEPGTVGPV